MVGAVFTRDPFNKQLLLLLNINPLHNEFELHVVLQLLTLELAINDPVKSLPTELVFCEII
jgi:hypothetical protein